jgi:hypothetical protein
LREFGESSFRLADFGAEGTARSGVCHGGSDMIIALLWRRKASGLTRSVKQLSRQVLELIAQIWGELRLNSKLDHD